MRRSATSENLLDTLIPKRSVSIPIAGQLAPLLVHYKGYSNNRVTLEFSWGPDSTTVVVHANTLRNAPSWSLLIEIAEDAFNGLGELWEEE